MQWDKDDELQQLLSYQERLADDEFSQSVTARIHRRAWYRAALLTVTTVLSLILAVSLLLSVNGNLVTQVNQWLTHAMQTTPYISLTITLTVAVAAIGWFTSREF